MKKISSIISSSNSGFITQKILQEKKYLKYDFQKLGVEIATKLDDLSHKSLYIKLCKVTDEKLIREAFDFAIDYNLKSGNRGKIFMWKLKELRK
ncbi:hypothetical protein IPJ91_02785 [bacterium]|nr:MAG: hypothetical protein IPJ91_02785 [bacterium]